MRNARKLITAVVTVLGLLAFSSAPAWAGQGYESVTGHFGEPCKSNPCGDGQFNEPTSIAVDDEKEDVYVLDSGNDRIEYFALNEGTKVYEYAGQFDETTPGKKLVKPTEIAVNNGPGSSKGDVYVADTGADVIDEFSETGEYKGQLNGGKCENGEEHPPCSGPTIPFTGLLDVTTDQAGDIWVYEAGQSQVYEFSDTGTWIEEHATQQSSEVPGFAVDSHGNVYATSGPEAGRVYEFAAGSGNKLKEKAASATAALAIIGVNNDLLVDEGSTIELFSSIEDEVSGAGFPAPVSAFPTGGLSESAGIAINGATDEGTLYATERAADDVDVFAEPSPEKPAVLSESASSVNSPEEGEFAAVIETGNRKTTYTFEYASTAAAVLEGNGTKVSGEAPAEFGHQTITSSPVGLSPAPFSFYYRVIVENEQSKGVPAIGPVQVYTKLPIITSEAFSALTSTSARLEAAINPVFTGGTTYTFEYSTEASTEPDGEKQLAGTIIKTGSGELPEGEYNIPLPVSAEITGLQPGQTYYYRVVTKNFISNFGGNANEGKPVDGKVEEVKPYAPPAAVTGEAQNITATAATFSGDVNPEGVEAMYRFAYISEAGFQEALKNGAANPKDVNYREQLAKGAPSPYAEGETTASHTLAATKNAYEAQAVGPIPSGGLLPGVTYHYALVAVNKYAIQTIGPDRMFTTAGKALPLVSTGGVSGVSQNSATLYGTVTTNGLQTNYGFEIGTSPNNYGPATGLGAIGGAATEEVHVTLGELQPGTTYYYRVTATNAEGTETGQPASFTTPGFPTLLSPPAAPPLIATPNIAFPKEEKNTGTSTKPLTTKQKLAKALKQCRRKHAAKRTACERTARKRFAPAKKRGRK